MIASERPTVVGVFRDRGDAEQGVEALRRAGFGPEQIGVLVRDEARREGVTVKADVRAEEGAATGAVTGGILGGLLGAAVAGAIPGVGPVLATGILAGVIGGGALGIATGGLIGALIGMGVPEEEAHYYEREFQAGRILVTVRSDGRRDEAVAILRRHGAYDVETAPVGAHA
jgi:hypothetical protein